MSEKVCAAARSVFAGAPKRLIWISCLVGLGLLSAGSGIMGAGGKGAFAAPARRPANVKAWNALYANLPLSFEVNRGQTDSRVKFLSRGERYALFLTSHAAVLSLASVKPGAGNNASGRPPRRALDVVRLRLDGSNRAAHAVGLDRLPGTANYFIGNHPSRWRTKIPTYARVKFESVYPGVDLVYYGRQGELENDFVVAAGSDPGRIRLGVDGAKGLEVDRAGDLVMKVGSGEVYLREPLAYQGKGAKRRRVAVHYVVSGKDEVGFALGRYDRGEELVIDPVLTYSTYLGGTGGDIGYGIAVDAAGNAYVTGIAGSSTFPTTFGSQSTTFGGSGDVFVAMINPNGAVVTGTATPQLVYSTFIGGAGTDSGAAIAVLNGDAFVTGYTASSNFPVEPPASATTTGPFQLKYGGGGDAFVAQLSSTGASLVYSSYLGGSGADFGYGIAVDSSGNAYVTGSTQSVDFPTASPLQQSNGGSTDAFVTKVNLAGSQELFSTYLGGSKADVAQSIQVDSKGDIFVAGYSFSSDFPLANPIQATNAGTVNAFVSEIDGASLTLSFSTYLGGSGDDRAYGLALDSSGNIYVTGSSQSSDFPTSAGAYQTANQGFSDAFVAKMNPSGSMPIYATLIGGSGTDQGNAIAVDSSGDAFITGFTQSNDYPTQNPIQAILGSTSGSLCGTTICADAFVTQLNPKGSGLVYSTFLGGSGADFGQSIALDSKGDAYITGSTSSTNFPATAGAHRAYQSSLSGVAGNAFVAVIGPADAPSVSLVPDTLKFGDQTEGVRSAVQTVTVTNAGTAPLTISQITFTETDTTGNTDFAETDNCVGGSLAASGGSCTISITFTPQSLTQETGTFSLSDNATGSPQIIDVSGTGVSSATSVTINPTSLSFGSVTVGNSSTPQSVTITNTGTQTLTINKISTTGDYSETDTCGAFLDLLNVGQSCSVSVVFSPTASGARAGSLSISDTATGSPQNVALTGTGGAEFTLSSSSPVSTILVGATTATFKISASAPSSFTGAITLACPGILSTLPTSPTCSWSPSKTIFAGQTATLTINNLDSTGTMASNSDDTFNFILSGSSGSQSATVNLTLQFKDYALAATPSFSSIVAGGAATYTINVTPLNGFNSPITLACGAGMPPGATCTFSQTSVTPGSGASGVKLTLQTTKTGSVPPVPPPGTLRPLLLALIALVAIVLFVSFRQPGWMPAAWRRPLRVQFVALGLLILLGLLAGACRPATSTSTTTTGQYIISITGTLNGNTSVVRSTKIDLSVACTPGSTGCS